MGVTNHVAFMLDVELSCGGLRRGALRTPSIATRKPARPGNADAE